MSGLESMKFGRDEMDQSVKNLQTPSQGTQRIRANFSTKTNFNISDDEGDGESSIRVLNETDTFVELKNKHRANLFVDIKKTIKSDCCESLAKI
ncbi:hypothetical protein Tco_1097134, partial [Tanacetum coccineum]